MIVLGIDPGSAKSAWVVYGMDALDFGIVPNEAMFDCIDRYRVDVVVFEMIGATFGASQIGPHLFETAYWTGRFAQHAIDRHIPVERTGRKTSVTHVTGSSRGNDSDVIRALLARFGPKGTKAQPGFLYGVANDVWQALAVAVTYVDQHGGS